ncbi:hypothetical protein LCGC14_1524740 [marine sediment metagenome]|uniref:Uncharacterized protein n=1 Tax=marine sediment metagenome TaxID=412755 RepID=A0A0F9LYJ9_9ZZZZ
MAEKIEMRFCKDCGIVVTDVRTGSRALFIIGDLEPFYKGTTPQLIGSDESGLGYRISVEYHKLKDKQFIPELFDMEAS